MPPETPNPEQRADEQEQPELMEDPEQKETTEKKESPTVMAVRERETRLQKAQEDLSNIQRRLDQLKSLQAQLDAGTVPDALSAADKQVFNEADASQNNSLADEIAALESQRDAAKQNADQEQVQLSEAMENLTPEEKLSTKIDAATALLGKEKISLGDVVKAIGMIIGALQEYFRYLKGELTEGKQEASGQPSSIEKGADVGGGDSRKQVREMLKAEGAPASADLLLTAKNEQKKTLDTKIKGDPSAPKDSPAQIGSERMRTELTNKRDTLQNQITELESKEKRTSEEDTALNQAKVDIARINGELQAADIAHEQNVTAMQKLEGEIKIITDAMEKAAQEAAKLEAVRSLAITKLPECALKAVLSEAAFGIAANKVDVSITLKGGKTFSKDVIGAMGEAGLQMTEVHAIGIDGTGTVTSPEQFMSLLQKLVQKEELKAAAQPKEAPKANPSAS